MHAPRPNTIRTALAGAASLALLAACAATPPASETASAASNIEVAAAADGEAAPDPRRGEPVSRLCFVSNISGFTETTRRSVVVEKGVNDQYLIETFGSCFNLDDALTLGFDTFARSGCLTRGDSIIASESAFGLNDRTGVGPQRCTIRGIYRWDPEAATDPEKTGDDGNPGSEDASPGTATGADSGTGT